MSAIAPIVVEPSLLGNLELKVKTFCEVPRVLAFLKEYIIFAEKDEELNKYILRQHQTDGVEKVVARALDGKRRRGLVWHTQGSGKTFTMIKTAEMLSTSTKFLTLSSTATSWKTRCSRTWPKNCAPPRWRMGL